MLTYRSKIYELAMAVSAEAAALAVSLSCLASQKSSAEYDDIMKDALPDLQREAASLRSAADELFGALPERVQSEARAGRFYRHIGFIDYWLDKKSPSACIGDPVDILQLDLPEILESFDKWYESQSPSDTALKSRLLPLIANGQLNAAVREVWAVFKTRIVEMFGLPPNLDGHKLVDKLFGVEGVTVGLLPDKERQGYLNLFKGLYTLNRNPTAHNDLPVNPDETDVVLTMVNATLVKLEDLRSATASSNSDPPILR